MAGPSNYPNGFPFGVTIRGMPINVTNPGQVFWVNNSTVLPVGGIAGSNGNKGTYQQPFSTIDYAIGQCTANRGDIIMVMPGHAETVDAATDIVMDVAGISIIGLGAGSKRPTLTFSVAATANIPITAANMTVKNILFVANFADVASVFTATGTNTPTDFTVEDCEFRDTSSILNFLTVVTGNATAGSMNGFTFLNNRVLGLGTTAATTAVKMAAAQVRQVYKGNFCNYPALNDTAALAAFGANNQTALLMDGNNVVRPSTSTTGGSLFSGGSTASSGYVINNYSWHLDNSAALLAPTGTALGFQNNYCMITGAADKSGLINPAAV
jgi:hypothetical protein